jgi:hypothetical protein
MALLRAGRPFAPTPDAQYSDGAGVGFAFASGATGRLTVANSWVSFPIEPEQDANGAPGWYVRLRGLDRWEGGEAAGAAIDPRERAAIAATVTRAIAASGAYANVVGG